MVDGGEVGAVLATVADRVGEASVAAASVVAVIAVAATLPALARRHAGRARLTPALVILTGGAAITFVAWLAFTVRCADAACHVRPGDTIVGLAPWWRIRGAWQWGAQLALASVGLVAASAALALAARGKRPARAALWVARGSYAIWAIVAFLIPAAWEIFVI